MPEDILLGKGPTERGHSEFKRSRGRVGNTSLLSNQKTSVRFGGAQISITHKISENLTTLKRAIDWAEENKVDYLVTPEGALSGYYKEYADTNELVQELYAAEKEIVSYASSKNIGLCLSTLWVDNEKLGQCKRDQTRYYDRFGKFLGSYNKIMTIATDEVVPGIFHPGGMGVSDTEEFDGHPSVKLFAPNDPMGKFKVGTLICNDMYGEDPYGTTIARRALFSLQNRKQPSELVIHPTYGLRGKEVDESLDPERIQAIRDWHKNHVAQLSWFTISTIFVVDSASNFGGMTSRYNTATPSGVCQEGKWVITVPSHGEQFFYYDFNLPLIDNDTGITPNLDSLGMLAANNPPPVEEL